jgi:hypothetical protein
MAIEKKIVIDVDAVKAAGGLDKLKDSLKEVNKEVEETQESSSKALDGVGKNAKKSSKGVSGLSKGFKGLGVAMKAAGIGLVIAALAKLSDIFMQNQKVADLFNTAFEAVSIAFNDFVGFIVDNSGVVVDFFKNIFENPLESVKALGASIKDNIVERFESFLDTLGYLASAVKKVFSGDFAGALEDVKNAGKESIDAITGVNNTFDKGVEFVEKNKDAVKGYITETIKAAKENVNLANAAELAAAQQSLLVEKYDIQAEQLRQIRDEERNSIEDRRKANDQLLEVLAEQEKAMLAQADAQLRSAQAELDKNASIENQVALTEALANKQGVLAQIEGFRSEQKANDLALDREEVELTNTKLESESTLSIERKRFNAEQIEDEVQRLEALKQIDLLEAEQEAIRLQAIVDNANAGTQAKVDAQIALDEFMEQSRQTNLTRDTEIVEAEIELEQQKTAAKQKALDDAISLAGAETGLGKALLIVKQGLALKEMIMEAKKTITFSKLAVAKSTVATAEGTAQTAKIGFPQNIPMLIGYAAQAAGIISAIKSATGAANSVAGTLGGGSASGGGASASTSQPPSFNIVGATETSQLAEAVGSQTQQPVQAYVVANDVTTAQSLENNIVEGATL